MISRFPTGHRGRFLVQSRFRWRWPRIASLSTSAGPADGFDGLANLALLISAGLTTGLRCGSLAGVLNSSRRPDRIGSGNRGSRPVT